MRLVRDVKCNGFINVRQKRKITETVNLLLTGEGEILTHDTKAELFNG